MGKIIIDNRSDLPDIDAIRKVVDAMKIGRISNDGKQYCYATLLYDKGRCKSYIVRSHLNKASDGFVVMNQRSSGNGED